MTTGAGAAVPGGPPRRATRTPSTRSRHDRGAAAVEFALVAPLLLAMALGIMEFGRVFNTQTLLSAASREGARTMALQNSATAARTSAKGAATKLALTDAQISVSSCPAAVTTPATSTTVIITYNFTFVTKLFGSGLTLKGTSVMRCNG
ncbi:MAG: pilus assembly protein TadE [Friedmanniella sp.]|nr:pilus assembly protein TadE [Friedmanniella sp.]